jgi:hypothetical protein
MHACVSIGSETTDKHRVFLNSRSVCVVPVPVVGKRATAMTACHWTLTTGNIRAALLDVYGWTTRTWQWHSSVVLVVVHLCMKDLWVLWDTAGSPYTSRSGREERSLISVDLRPKNSSIISPPPIQTPSTNKHADLLLTDTVEEKFDKVFFF